MKSQDVLRDVDVLFKSKNYHEEINIEYLSENSNDLKENTCFICIKGSKFDGHDLIQSLPIKPVLIIATREIETDIPYIIVPDTLASLPQICANFFRNPSTKLDLIGVTGTDGKTTSALIMHQLINYFKECSYIGTNGFYIRNNQFDNPLTTPKSIMLNQFLENIVSENIPYATLEVSSQGIDLHRIDKLKFKVAVFTNLTHEHLDYHQTIENYFLTKLRLFQMLDEDTFAIVNLDSPFAQRIIEATKAKVITYGRDINSDFVIANINSTLTNTTFDLVTKKAMFKDIRLSLFGDYNVYNATAALATLDALGFDLNDIIPKLRLLHEIDGRMHFVDCGQPYLIIVDFAHTPNALRSLLSNIRNLNMKRLTIVFGAAGERDKTKRPLMGSVAEEFASSIILTSEDPKSEDTLDIINDIAKGINDIYKVSIIPNRKKAILKALENATIDDVIVITGKGNEKYEIFDGFAIQHNDITIVEDYLHEKYQPQYIYSIANY